MTRYGADEPLLPGKLPDWLAWLWFFAQRSAAGDLFPERSPARSALRFLAAGQRRRPRRVGRHDDALAFGIGMEGQGAGFDVGDMDDPGQLAGIRNQFGQPVGQASFQSAVWRRVIEVEAAALRESCREVWLVGHSMGATLALDHVVRGGTVDGLVLITPLIEVAQARSVLMPPRAWFELGRKVWPSRALIETAFPVDMQEPLPGLDEMRDLYLPMAAYGEMFAVVDHIQGQAAAISCPVLMAVAPSDLVVDSEAAQMYFKDLGSSRKHLLAMPGSGHVLPLDREWSEMVEALEQFTRK
jgi:carboxylesterase